MGTAWRRKPSWLIKSPYREEKYYELGSEEFNRALESFVLCECSRDDLDADDAAYIERFVRYLPPWTPYGPCGPGLEAEQTFWTAPYGVEPGVPRQLGTGARPAIPAELRKAYDAARRLRRQPVETTGVADDPEAAAELAREQAAWDIEQTRLAGERERRLKQMAEADREWEQRGQELRKRALARARKGPQQHWPRDRSRFYVPQWKVEEKRRRGKLAYKARRDAQAAALREQRREQRAAKRAAKEHEAQQRGAQRQAEEQQRAAETERQRKEREQLAAQLAATAERERQNAQWRAIGELDEASQITFLAGHPEIWPQPKSGRWAAFKTHCWLLDSEVAGFVNSHPSIAFTPRGLNGSIRWLTRDR